MTRIGDQTQDMGFFEFLLEISYRPPNIIFIILGFILIVWGWPNVYSGALNSFHWGNFLVGLTGALLVLAAVAVEINVRRGKWAAPPVNE